MIKPSWHSKVISVVKELAKDFKYETMYPSNSISERDDRVVMYNPDVIWIKGHKGIHVVIWEVEKGSSNKTFAGCVALASLARTSFAEFYPWEDFEIGSRFREPETFVPNVREFMPIFGIKKTVFKATKWYFKTWRKL
jgi:hypothetical protein